MQHIAHAAQRSEECAPVAALEQHVHLSHLGASLEAVGRVHVSGDMLAPSLLSLDPPEVSMLRPTAMPAPSNPAIITTASR